MRQIYLDHNATTPIAPEVAAAMRPWIEEQFGNPSSSHEYGLRARQAAFKPAAEAPITTIFIGISVCRGGIIASQYKESCK